MQSESKNTSLVEELVDKGYVMEGDQPTFILQGEEFKGSFYKMMDGEWLVYCPIPGDDQTHIAKEWTDVERFFRSRL
jgi:hypothetical protein